jgi:hypothetical protein
VDLKLQGTANMPIAAYSIGSGPGQSSDSYYCVNPKCEKKLRGKFCDVHLSTVFDACKFSRRTKKHTWRTLDIELYVPGTSKELDRSYKYCSSCGVLQVVDEYSDEESYCAECLLSKCVCKPCHLCRLMPSECRCSPCDTCNLCTGCKVCKQTCECDYCETCDLPTDECECSSSCEFF